MIFVLHGETNIMHTMLIHTRKHVHLVYWPNKELIRGFTSEVSQTYSTYLCHYVISASSLKNSKRQTKTWVELENLKLIMLCIPISKFNDNYQKNYET
jgi:hypothetical protein